MGKNSYWLVAQKEKKNGDGVGRRRGIMKAENGKKEIKAKHINQVRTCDIKGEGWRSARRWRGKTGKNWKNLFFTELTDEKTIIFIFYLLFSLSSSGFEQVLPMTWVHYYAINQWKTYSSVLSTDLHLMLDEDFSNPHSEKQLHYIGGKKSLILLNLGIKKRQIVRADRP